MTPAGLTIEDQLKLETCQKDSYVQALPYAGVLGLGTLAAVKGGFLKRHATRGALPKVAVATLVGYILGKLHYTDACITRTLQEVAVRPSPDTTQTKAQNTGTWSEVGEFASVYNNQGRRQYNEDRAVIQKLKGWGGNVSDVHVFSVLDGHGGQMVVDLARKNLFESLGTSVRKLKLITSSIPRQEKLELYSRDFGDVPGAVTQYLDATSDVTRCFNNSSSIMSKYYKAKGSIIDYISPDNKIMYPELLTDQVLKCDQDILAVSESLGDRSGSTLLLALLDGSSPGLGCGWQM